MSRKPSEMYFCQMCRREQWHNPSRPTPVTCIKCRGRVTASHNKDGTWMQSAACRDSNDLHLFFPETITEYHARAWMKYCGVCPVTRECADFGRDEFGVWGGEAKTVKRVPYQPQQRTRGTNQ